MQIVPLQAAADRLTLCHRAFESMKESNPQPRTFSLHWSDYLMQWKGVYTKVQQAAKSSPKEVQWFGSVNKERRADPLLRYLFEARNDGEHSIRRSIERSADCYTLAPFGDGPATIAAMVPGPDGRIRFLDASGSETVRIVEFEPGNISLQEVTERDGKRKVPPPTMHMDEPMEPNPLVAADLGLRWIEALVWTAQALHEA